MKPVLQRIRFEGHSKVVAVTKLLPNDWVLARCSVIRKNKTTILVKFEKVE